MITGSCLCGGVQYNYHGIIRELVICHCNQCKRAQGNVFATNAPVESRLLKFTQGESLLKVYYSNPQKQRVFCCDCGSPIYSAHDDKPGIYRLRAGTITSPLERTPDYQQYCESKTHWIDLDETIPAYQRQKSTSLKA